MSYANLSLNLLAGLYCICSSSQNHVVVTILLSNCSCFLKMYLTCHASVGGTTYTYKSGNHVNVYGRDVNFDFQKKPG